ncbi:hypothetical protein LTR17_004635 [Elasticomyces elasticus]|nr:hypothetical protein LTR17_004635 [Elasticomyces elasticus]
MSAPTQQRHPNPPATAKAPRKAFQVLASPVLSRPPLLTRELTSFEKAFYLYQKRLNERLALPFTRYFYYKEGTPGDIEWKRKIKARKTAARDIGVYAAYGDEGWNDEVLVGDKTADRETTIEALVRDAEGKDIIDAETVGDADKGGLAVTGDARAGEGQRRELTKIDIERPVPRVTEADQKGDMKSLSRKLDRTLYLLVKNKEGRWRFPEDRIYGKENLHQAAERVLIQAFGINMNTWIVGTHPVGHHQMLYTSGGAPAPRLAKIAPNHLVSTSQNLPEHEQEEYGEKVFFMKGRMMSGQADLSKNEYKDQEFRWLAREEVEEVVTGGYWRSVRDAVKMLIILAVRFVNESGSFGRRYCPAPSVPTTSKPPRFNVTTTHHRPTNFEGNLNTTVGSDYIHSAYWERRPTMKFISSSQSKSKYPTPLLPHVSHLLTSSSANMTARQGASKKENLLLTIPPEIRNWIYELALIEPHSIKVANGMSSTHTSDECDPTSPTLAPPGLLTTCQQIRNEALPVYHGRNIFEIHIHGTCLDFTTKYADIAMLQTYQYLRKLCEKQRKMLGRLIVCTSIRPSTVNYAVALAIYNEWKVVGLKVRLKWHDELQDAACTSVDQHATDTKHYQITIEDIGV